MGPKTYRYEPKLLSTPDLLLHSSKPQTALKCMTGMLDSYLLIVNVVKISEELGVSDKPGYLTFDTAAVTWPAYSDGTLQRNFLQ